MKTVIVILLLLFGIYSCSYSQNMGTIVVNENKSATLSFSSKIDFVIFGNNPSYEDGSFLYYDFFKDGSVCVIRGNNKEAPNTSITIKLNDDSVWYGIISFGDNTELFYDFRVKTTPDASTNHISNSHSNKTGNLNRLDVNLEKIKELNKEYFTIGEKSGQVTFSVSNIRNDKQNTYILLSVNNQSGNIYSVDGILFKFIEGKRRGVKRGEARIEERIMPIKISGNLSIKAYSNEEIAVAIPLYAIGRSGKLEITLREKDGTRNVIISVPGSIMSKVKVFRDEN